ncbi:diguanylate cyclase (GGDEF)-like protein [Pseudomonas fluvialis]|uniref:diguanylate cyclase n=1 Tax=Pseudomonas fluvialis TaxID=1793966 RepID=A0A7X0EV42_9PSED|nr:GGDEF domain-containing protein [Pseudomonas fluvialis]MBB6342201.1 diguanylate cyclase (GGDEF)-like protein [Pseudomonas fluvialis]
MPNLLRHHRLKLTALLLAANLGLLLHLAAGDLKAMAEWVWLDLIGEGGSALLALAWLGLILKSRPAGRVTNLLAIGLGCVFFSWWVDLLDEFIQIPDAITWDHWLESAPMPLGLLLLTYGLYHWHHEQLAISAQMEKRERLFREHRLFDKLTPLGGADYLRRQLELSLAQSSREQQPLSLVVIDIDDFDSINQRYGHAEGDRVLQAVTQQMLLNLRHQDLLCRLAGDRFVVLLSNTGETLARTLATELAQSIAHLAHKSRQHGERLFLSATTATVMALQESPENLLQRLNLALAKAKQPLALSA